MHRAAVFQRRRTVLWVVSLLIVTASNLVTGQVEPLTLAATDIGITALIFAAKGNVWAQILMIIFCLLYGLISFQVRYWGEMITYLGMSLPMAIWSTITWLRNPSADGKTVDIQKLTRKHVVGVAFFGALTTGVFYLILRALGAGLAERPHVYPGGGEFQHLFGK